VTAAARALDASARLWFAAAVAGQAMFLVFILLLYGPTTLSGDFAAWNQHKDLIKGYVPGDTAGNLAFAAHVLLAAVVTFGGTLQLVPQIRAHAPAVHRWIGRAFLVTAIAASLAGLYMTWGRPTARNLTEAVAISIDGVLILAFAALAWRTAIARQFAAHRRWAMRTFVVANGVWFLRVGVSAWGMTRQVVGEAMPSTGDFFVVWNFGCYLVPLLILELYLRAKAPGPRFAMAGGLVLATAVMSLGIAAAWLGMFYPTLARL
jgi:hypothetical protein